MSWLDPRRRAETKAGAPPSARGFVADTYIAGHGIEIGALHRALPVPQGTSVLYVDRMGVKDLRIQYPELANEELVEVGLIDDGQRLAKVPDASADFVIANHFLEHAANPIGTVENVVRVLKPGGVLFMALPDKRYTFDRDRQITTWEHMLADYEDGGAGSRDGHFLEWARFIDEVEESKLQERAAELMAMDYSIHFHVWTYDEMVDMVLRLRHRIGFEVEAVLREGIEVVFLMRKAPVAT